MKQNKTKPPGINCSTTGSDRLSQKQKDFSDFSLCGQKDSSDLGGEYLISDPPPGSAETSSTSSAYFGTLTMRDGEKGQIICLIYA